MNQRDADIVKIKDYLALTKELDLNIVKIVSQGQ